MEFQATIELNGKTATGIEVPADVLEVLGGGKRPAVMVTLNGYSYRSTIGSMGGRAMIPLSAEHRTGSGASAGDEVTVTLELDTAPREVEVPADLDAALAAAPAAKAAFDALSYSAKRRHTLSVEGAKTDATRARRVAKAISDLAGD